MHPAKVGSGKNSPKCPQCQGHGLVIAIRATNLYKCGWTQVAVNCPTCRPERFAEPVDRKMAAAGDDTLSEPIPCQHCEQPVHTTNLGVLHTDGYLWCNGRALSTRATPKRVAA